MSRRMLRVGLAHVFGLQSVLALVFVPAVAEAHFSLSAPPNWTNQSSNGSPQKDWPCGNENDPMATGPTTPFTAGQEITVTISETVAHDGHYRVALAESGDMMDLPADMSADASGATCMNDDMKASPVYPVLADGMLEHTGKLSGPQSFKVTLPSDVTCDKCVLQVREYMKGHSNTPETPTSTNGCYYHHCAFISISGGSSGAGGMGSGGKGSGGAGGASAGASQGGMATTAGTGGTVAQGGVMGGGGMSSMAGAPSSGGRGGAGAPSTTGGSGGSGGTGGTSTAAGGQVSSSGGTGTGGTSGGTGGAGGGSGTSTSTSGSAGSSAPAGNGTQAPDDSGGCGCRVPASGQHGHSGAIALGLGLWLAQRRRRRA
jgi:hypothetical protein